MRSEAIRCRLAGVDLELNSTRLAARLASPPSYRLGHEALRYRSDPLRFRRPVTHAACAAFPVLADLVLLHQVLGSQIGRRVSRLDRWLIGAGSRGPDG